QISRLYNAFDINRDGAIDYIEFIRGLRQEPSAQRQVLIRHVFDAIDFNSDGVLSREEVMACFNPAAHPEVKRGRLTCGQMRSDMLGTLDAFTSPSGVTWSEFLEFYSTLTAFADDAAFREALGSVWALPQDHQLKGRNR
ncbi:unnamed protein product, partial [Chrysoparadoxa australica]